MAGLELASGDAVVVMDVDLQDPPEIIPEMLEHWRNGSDVVVAQRSSRTGETVVKRIVAYLGYRLINRISDVEIPRDTGDFRLMDRRVVDQLLRFKETHGFLRGLVALVGFEQSIVQFERPQRHAGKGKYNRFLGSLRIGINGLVGFSTALLSLSTLVGFVSAIAAFVTAVAYAGFKLAGTNFPVGNPTIVILVLLVGGVQLICLGIAGQYIGRIYEEVKHRPRFIIDRAAGFEVQDTRGIPRSPRDRRG
jgi:dolichol-phosphate mannosyltransferase